IRSPGSFCMSKCNGCRKPRSDGSLARPAPAWLHDARWCGGSYPLVSRCRLFDKSIAQRTDTGDFDLDHVAGLQIGGGAVGSHPDHIAWPQRKIFRQLDDERLDAEDHVIGAETIALVAVDLHDGFHLFEID